jgi:single-stranded-DNA-specific exonuclease
MYTQEIDAPNLDRQEVESSRQGNYILLDAARLPQNEVWGRGFPAPLFMDESRSSSSACSRKKHLKLRLKKSNARFESIRFNFTAQPGNRTRAAYRLGINEYMGIESPQLMVEHFD